MNTTPINATALTTADPNTAIGTEPTERGSAEFDAMITRKRRMLAGLATFAALAGAGGAWAGIAGAGTAGAAAQTSIQSEFPGSATTPELF